MARNKFDTCMFCNQLPCSCSKKTPVKKTPKSRVAKPAAAAVTTTPQPIAPEPKRTVTPIRVTSPPRRPIANLNSRPDHSAIRSVKSDDERELARAITVLANAGLLHKSELARHRKLIDLPAWRVDALIWKQDVA